MLWKSSPSELILEIRMVFKCIPCSLFLGGEMAEKSPTFPRRHWEVFLYLTLGCEGLQGADLAIVAGQASVFFPLSSLPSLINLGVRLLFQARALEDNLGSICCVWLLTLSYPLSCMTTMSWGAACTESLRLCSERPALASAGQSRLCAPLFHLLHPSFLFLLFLPIQQLRVNRLDYELMQAYGWLLGQKTRALFGEWHLLSSLLLETEELFLLK